MLGLSCCVGYSLAEMSGGYSPVAVCRVLIGVSSRVAELGLKGVKASVVAAQGLSSCGSWALEHRLNSCGEQA